MSSAQIVLSAITQGSGCAAASFGLPDLALAYKWFNLAARYPASIDDRDVAMKASAAVAARMNRQDIAEGERLIQAWHTHPVYHARFCGLVKADVSRR